MECKKADNSAKCPCVNADCERHGICCECLASHLSRKTLPRCCFPPAPEPTSRSFEAFAKAWKV